MSTQALRKRRSGIVLDNTLWCKSLPRDGGCVILPATCKMEASYLERRLAGTPRSTARLEVRKNSNELPRELVLNLLAQGYPLEELLEFFPMFTLDQLMLLLDDEIIH